MTLREIMDAFRRRVDDAVAPYLWSDDDVISFANDAVKEAALRGRFLLDETTTAVCRILLRIGVADYPLHDSILEVTYVYLDSTGLMLPQVSARTMHEQLGQWRTNTGTPDRVMLDVTMGRLRVYPTPTATDTLRLSVVRLPINTLVNDSDVPEIPAQYHYGLVDWIARLAYLCHDSEKQDLQRAMESEARFTAEFGPRLGNARQLDHLRRARPRTAAGGFV